MSHDAALRWESLRKWVTSVMVALLVPIIGVGVFTLKAQVREVLRSDGYETHDEFQKWVKSHEDWSSAILNGLKEQNEQMNRRVSQIEINNMQMQQLTSRLSAVEAKIDILLSIPRKQQ